VKQLLILRAIRVKKKITIFERGRAVGSRRALVPQSRPGDAPSDVEKKEDVPAGN
jgi:hypothetical protein